MFISCIAYARWCFRLKRRLRGLVVSGVVFLLSGCLFSLEPALTEANSVEAAESGEFQRFFGVLIFTKRNTRGGLFWRIPFPPSDLRVAELPGTNMMLVQQFFSEEGICEDTGCYNYFAIRVSDTVKAERCEIVLGFRQSELEQSAIAQAARLHNVKLTPSVDNNRVQGFEMSGASDDIFSFLVGQFSENPLDCASVQPTIWPD